MKASNLSVMRERHGTAAAAPARCLTTASLLANGIPRVSVECHNQFRF